MERSEIKRLLAEKYLAPTEKPRRSYIGIEVEMPIVNLSGGAVDYAVSRAVMERFLSRFSFTPDKLDEDGCCYSATCPGNGDNISFDCSYNNLELSLGRAEELAPLEERFTAYVSFLNEEFERYHYLLTGMGINPGRNVNRRDYIPAERYRMLERYLLNYRIWNIPMHFHRYPDFGAFASASQVQLDVRREELIPTLQTFSLLEPVKAVLFSNSLLPEEPELLCARDMLWENSAHGINPHNIGMYDCPLETTEDLLEYICTTSIFCAEREGRYIHFRPVPITEYLERESITGEFYENGTYHPVTVCPRPEDLQYLRTYKFEDLTYRGTIEFRSVCNQPLSEALCVAAFHLGIKENLRATLRLLETDRVLYHHGYSAAELRRLMNRREWPSFVERETLRQLCLSVLELAREGLTRRKRSEEHYLAPLYDRAERLTSPGRAMAEALEHGVPMNRLVREYSLL